MGDREQPKQLRGIALHAQSARDQEARAERDEKTEPSASKHDRDVS